MSQKEATMDFTKFMFPITLALMIGATCYGIYFGFSYWRGVRLYNANEVLSQVLEDYDKANQGYPGGWETLQEVSRIAAIEQQSTPLESYFVALRALATSQVDPNAVVSDEYSEAVKLANNSIDSQAIRDFLTISYALSTLDQEGNGREDDLQSIKILESFYDRLKDNSGESGHFFDEYASYMLAYYYYVHDTLDEAMKIWKTISDLGDASQSPSRWWQLSKAFVK